MPYVNVPKDLTKVKTKVVFNLTKRQLICFSVAAVIGIPIYFLTKGTIGNSAALLLMIGAMAPFFFIAMYERDGQPAERIMKHILRHKIWPGIRPYKTDNLYRYLTKEDNTLAYKTTNSAKTTPARQHQTGKSKQG